MSTNKKDDRDKAKKSIKGTDHANKGSGAFNQGSEQDKNYNDGTKVSDEEKKTGHSPSNLGKQERDS